MTSTQDIAQDIQLLFSPQGIQDPHPIYARLHRAGPVIPLVGQNQQNQALVLGHAAVSALLRDPRAGADRMPVVQDPAEPGFDAFGALKPMMLFLDGEAHVRLRGLATKAFTPRVVAEQRELVQRTVTRLLDGAQARGHLDVMRDLAVPLPVAVILEMLGLDPEGEERFKVWSDAIAALLDGTTRRPEDLAGIDASVREMQAYFRDVADDLRAHPRPGLMTALALAEEQGDRLSNEELLANAILLLAAGHETTTNLLSGGLLALLENPDQLALLRERPDLTENAVEELLRYVSPVQGTGRRLVADVTVEGVHLPAGTWLALLTGAANRDPGRFPDPDTLDVTRENAARHVAFGSGPHYCLGASLARLEGQVAIRAVLDRWPHLTLPEQPLTYRNNFVLRGLTDLRVDFQPEGTPA